jgi:hypothetical protein
LRSLMLPVGNIVDQPQAQNGWSIFPSAPGDAI